MIWRLNRALENRKGKKLKVHGYLGQTHSGVFQVQASVFSKHPNPRNRAHWQNCCISITWDLHCDLTLCHWVSPGATRHHACIFPKQWSCSQPSARWTCIPSHNVSNLQIHAHWHQFHTQLIVNYSFWNRSMYIMKNSFCYQVDYQVIFRTK